MCGFNYLFCSVLFTFLIFSCDTVMMVAGATETRHRIVIYDKNIFYWSLLVSLSVKYHTHSLTHRYETYKIIFFVSLLFALLRRPIFFFFTRVQPAFGGPEEGWNSSVSIVTVLSDGRQRIWGALPWKRQDCFFHAQLRRYVEPKPRAQKTRGFLVHSSVSNSKLKNVLMYTFPPPCIFML